MWRRAVQGWLTSWRPAGTSKSAGCVPPCSGWGARSVTTRQFRMVVVLAVIHYLEIHMQGEDLNLRPSDDEKRPGVIHPTGVRGWRYWNGQRWTHLTDDYSARHLELRPSDARATGGA